MSEMPEFSRIINVTRLAPGGTVEQVEAKSAERAELAKRFDLEEISSLSAQLALQPGGQQTLKVAGKIIADIVQKCVVTLDPLPSHIEIDVDMTFVPADTESGEENLLDQDTLEGETEFYSSGKIDLGEMVSQHLGVNIDLYPRKSGVVLPVTEFGSKAEKPHPFAQLVKKTKNDDKTRD